MFCYQCEETVGPCNKAGVCGKDKTVAGLQDALVYAVKRVAKDGKNTEEENRFIIESLFVTITNVNFNAEDIEKRIEKAKVFVSITDVEIEEKKGIEKEKDEDKRSLKETLTYGIKGMAAYLYHAQVLGYNDAEIEEFIRNGLSRTLEESSAEELRELVLEAGSYGVKTMELLDSAHNSTYGQPEPTEVSTSVGNRPGILVSGHDLRDLKELLEQTKDKGIDVYTNGEMLPAHYYPGLKKYQHLYGNYGGSWPNQTKDFESFNGPVLLTTNCLVPPKESYKDRIYTTGPVSFSGCEHIPERKEGEQKDFSKIIEHAKQTSPPQELENVTIKGGYAHGTVLSVADKIVEAVNNGAIKKFIVMAGCDGRHKERGYYTEFAKNLPENTIILTAGCAKYRYNKLKLGEIGGIPRVLDAGQCNDCYSLVVIAKKLAEAFKMDNINDLPVAYNIAWYEQKAVIVLLSLLSLDVKNIHIGPKAPAFLSANVLSYLQDEFGIGLINDVESDMKKMLG
ncbi:MAG: hydroxylamine reductase [Nanoarchaeota archaeon]